MLSLCPCWLRLAAIGVARIFNWGGLGQLCENKKTVLLMTSQFLRIANYNAYHLYELQAINNTHYVTR